MLYREIVKRDSEELHNLLSDIISNLNKLKEKINNEYKICYELIEKENLLKRKYGIDYGAFKECDTFILNLKLKTLGDIIDEINKIKNVIADTDNKALSIMLEGEDNE